MPKGNNYSAATPDAAVAKAQASLTQLAADLAFVPNLGPDLLTSATITPERLPLAEKALAVAQAAPDLLRRATPPGRLPEKLAAYRKLLALYTQLEPLHERLKNALNVLGADMLFDVGNIHEDVEKDNGETQDLGALRTELDAYYRRPGAKAGKSKPAPGTTSGS